MGKPYSDDLRERVIAAIEAGHTREEVAELFNMALKLTFKKRVYTQPNKIGPTSPRPVRPCGENS